MHDTAIRTALERSGLLPRMIDPTEPTTPRSAPSFHPQTTHSFPDVSTLSDKDIIDQISFNRVEANAIERHLEDEKEAGDYQSNQAWRAKAKKARRAKLIRIDQLTEEARRRQVAAEQQEKLRIAADRERARAAEIERREHDKAAKEAERAARQAPKERAQASREIRSSRDNMFRKAAYTIISGEECKKIWHKAKLMFPNDPTWDVPLADAPWFLKDAFSTDTNSGENDGK